MKKLNLVLADLEAETADLDALVAVLKPPSWSTPTPSEGWDVAAQIGHLTWTDETALAAATDSDIWAAILHDAGGDVTDLVNRTALSYASAPPEDLLGRWRRSRRELIEALRSYPEGEKLPWFGPPMSPVSMASARFMETWAHSLDVHEALGADPVRSDRVRHVVLLGTMTRTFAFRLHGLPSPQEDVYVSLTLPSGAEWTHGPPDAPNTVSGSAYDFGLCVTQRRHRDDLDLISRGAVADTWLDIAQAFAGPPGSGRPRMSF